MKKTALLCILALLLGGMAGLLVNLAALGGMGLLPPEDPAVTIPALPLATPEPLDPADNTLLLDAGDRVLEALKERDYAGLAELVHPDLGVRFTPYSTVDPDSDLTLTAQQVRQAGSDKNKYTWGTIHGSGAPIRLTIGQYLDDYVFNEDYTTAPLIGADYVIASGNALENVDDAYPDGRFVEYYFPGVEPQYEGIDWCALKLVFQDYQGGYRLVGVIHSQWTI